VAREWAQRALSAMGASTVHSTGDYYLHGSAVGAVADHSTSTATGHSHGPAADHSAGAPLVTDILGRSRQTLWLAGICAACDRNPCLHAGNDVRIMLDRKIE
jgi:hypothetical protein